VRCLAGYGALPRTIHGVEGEGRIVADIIHQYDSSRSSKAPGDHSEATLLRNREKDSVALLHTRSTFRQVLQQRLTDRQREVLRAALDAGYYEW